MSEELSNVQHNLNADVDISFESGIESILRFAEQVESVNSVFSQLSFTAENLEDKIVRKFNELGNLLNDSKSIADVNEAVAKKIQHKINRYISQYVENLDFSPESVRLNKQLLSKFNKDFSDNIDKFIRELEKGSVKLDNKDIIFKLNNYLNNLKNSVRDLYSKIFNDEPNEKYIAQLEDVRKETLKKLALPKVADKLGDTLKQFTQQVEKLFDDVIANYKENLQSHTKNIDAGGGTVISKTTLEKLQRRVKQAILDSLDIKFGTKALNITIDKSSFENIQKTIAEHFNELIKNSKVQFELDNKDGVTVNTDPAKKISKKVNAKLKNLEKQLDELLEKILVETDEAQRIELGVKFVELNKEIERLTASTGEEVLRQADKAKKTPLASGNIMQKFIEKFSRELESLIDVSKIEGLNTIKVKISALDKNFKGLDQNLQSILADKETGIDKEIIVFKSNIEELGKNFENINALLKSANVVGLRSSIESLINGLNSLANDINSVSTQFYTDNNNDDRVVGNIKKYKYAYDNVEQSSDKDSTEKLKYIEKTYDELFKTYIGLSSTKIKKLNQEDTDTLHALKETTLFNYFNGVFEGSTYDLIEEFKKIGKKVNPALYSKPLKIDVSVEALYKTIIDQINEIIVKLTDILKNDIGKLFNDISEVVNENRDINSELVSKLNALNDIVWDKFIPNINTLSVQFNELSDLLGSSNLNGLKQSVENFVTNLNRLNGDLSINLPDVKSKDLVEISTNNNEYKDLRRVPTIKNLISKRRSRLELLEFMHNFYHDDIDSVKQTLKSLFNSRKELKKAIATFKEDRFDDDLFGENENNFSEEDLNILDNYSNLLERTEEKIREQYKTLNNMRKVQNIYGKKVFNKMLTDPDYLKYLITKEKSKLDKIESKYKLIQNRYKDIIAEFFDADILKMTEKEFLEKRPFVTGYLFHGGADLDDVNTYAGFRHIEGKGFYTTNSYNIAKKYALNADGVVNYIKDLSKNKFHFQEFADKKFWETVFSEINYSFPELSFEDYLSFIKKKAYLFNKSYHNNELVKTFKGKRVATNEFMYKTLAEYLKSKGVVSSSEQGEGESIIEAVLSKLGVDTQVHFENGEYVVNTFRNKESLKVVRPEDVYKEKIIEGIKAGKVIPKHVLDQNKEFQELYEKYAYLRELVDNNLKRVYSVAPKYQTGLGEKQEFFSDFSKALDYLAEVKLHHKLPYTIKYADLPIESLMQGFYSSERGEFILSDYVDLIKFKPLDLNLFDVNLPKSLDNIIDVTSRFNYSKWIPVLEKVLEKRKKLADQHFTNFLKSYKDKFVDSDFKEKVNAFLQGKSSIEDIKMDLSHYILFRDDGHILKDFEYNKYIEQGNKADLTQERLDYFKHLEKELGAYIPSSKGNKPTQLIKGIEIDSAALNKINVLIEITKNIPNLIELLGNNFKIVEANLQNALDTKAKGLDVHIGNLPAIILELGKNFGGITTSLQKLDVGVVQTAIDAFENTLKKLNEIKVKNQINVNIDNIIENLNKNLKELQQQLRNSDNGITAARLIVDGINQKIEQFVKSLIALSAKIVNVDTATLSIKLTPEQLQSLEAQLEGVNIVNVNEISGPINTALKNLLGNAGKIIESQLSNIMNQEDIKIPKLQTKKIVSQLTTLVNTFMTGYVNAVAENSLIYKPLEIKTKDLPQSIKNALAKKAGVSLEDYLKRTPTIGGATVLAETLEQNMGALSAKLHEAAMNNENRLFSEYKNAIKGIKVKVDTSPVEYFTNNITSIQQEIIAKIKEIMRVQFSEINKQIKELKAVPVGFNYVPKNIPSTIPVKTATVQSYGAKVNIPRGTVNIPVPYRVGDDLDFTTIYQKAGGLGSHVNNRTLLNSILNTMRYILAGSLLKGPYAYLYQGWESAKDFEASLVKAQINLSGSNEELFRDFARTRIEKAVELGVTNALSHLKGITDTEAMVDAEVAFLKKYVTEDVRKDLQNISLRYIISQAQLGQMFEIASRSTTDPFEARAITETAARLFAAEPGVGSPEEIADALQASIVQMGMTGFDTKRLSEIFFNISTNFRVSTKDLLKFTATAGAVMSDELKNYQTEELAKLKQEIESATGSRRKELEERYKQVKLDTDIALTGLIGALITEGSNKTGTEAARMMIQFFNSLNTPETRKLLEDIAGSNPKYASILPYKYTPNQEGLPFTEKTSGIESFFTILKLANEMESQGDARLAGEMLRKVFGRYTGAGKAVDKMIEIIMQRFPEYRKEGKDPVQGIIEDFKKNSDLFMEEAIAKNNMTLAKRTERAAVTWEAAMSNVFMEFKDDISFAMDAITNILRIIRDNADFVAGLIKNLINILIGAGVRHYGGKLFDKINANVLASERDLLVEPWKQKIKEDIKQRAEMQKDLLNYDEKLSKAVNVYESARQAYFNLTGVNLGDVDEKNQPQFTNKSVREILNTSDDAVERALLALYSSQIDSEKASRYTIEGNNIGFNMYDAKILSKFAEKLKSGNKLSPDEIRKARQRLLKYSGQLSEFGPELFDSDTDIALVTGQSTGDGGIIGRLKAKASMLEENLQMFKNDNILLNVVGGSISGILPRSKEELLTRANKYIQSLESLVDEDDDIAMLKQLLDNEQEDSKEYAKLVEDINKRRSQVETSLGIPRLKEALEAYKSSEIDFESVANTIKEFEDNLQKIKSGIPVNRVEAESEEQENLLRLKALREAYVTLYGEDATNDKKLNNINQRISMSQRRLEKIKSGQFTNSEIEQLVDQLNGMKQFNVTPENYGDMVETLNQIKAAVAVYEDEAEKILNKATRAASTISELSLGKGKHVNKLAELDTAIAESHNVVKNIIEAYSNMGAAPRIEKGKSTIGGLKDTKLLKTIDNLKQGYIKTIAEMVPVSTNAFIDAVNSLTDRMFNKKILGKLDEEQVEKAILKAMGGDYTEADKLFGEKSKDIVLGYEEINTGISNAKKLVDNLSKQKQIIQEISKLRESDELKNYKDYITDKGEIYEEKFYSDKIPGYSLDKSDDENIKKQTQILKSELDSIGKTQAGQKLLELRKQLNNLTGEADALANASRRAAQGQAQLSDATKRLVTEHELGVTKDSEFIEALKKEQGSKQQSPMQLALGSLVGSVASIAGNIALSWVIGAVTTFSAGRLAQLFESRATTAQLRYERASDIAQRVDEIERLKGTSDGGWDLNLKKSRLGWDMILNNIPFVSDLILGKRKISEEQMSKIIGGKQSRVEALAELKKQALEEEYLSEKTFDAVNTEIFKKLNEAIRGSNNAAMTSEARLYSVETWIDFAMNKLVGPEERDINYESLIKKLELRSKGIRDTSQEMIDIEVQTAKKLADLYEKGAAFIKAKMEIMEKEAGELGIDVNTEAYLKLKENYLILKEKAAQAQSIVSDVFSQLNRLFADIEADLSNALIGIDIADISSKIQRWRSGIPEYSGVAINQQISVLQSRVSEYKKAEEEERQKLARLKDDEKNSGMYKDLETKYKSTVEKRKQAEYDLVVAMQQLPISSAETLMNMAAATADVEARIALAKAQLKGLGEDSLYARLMQKQRLEKINEAYGSMIAALNEQYNKKQGDYQKIWIEMKELEAKQLENLVAIKKLNENKISFNLPDGLRVMTYNDYLQSTGNERSFTSQFKAFNLNINFGDVTVRSDNDIRNIVRNITNQVPIVYKNGLRIR
jgi:hypothetical protein